MNKGKVLLVLKWCCHAVLTIFYCQPPSSHFALPTDITKLDYKSVTVNCRTETFNLLKPTGCVMHHQFNLSKPTGYVVHQQFNILKPTGYVVHQQFNLLKSTGYVMHQQINLLKPTG